VAILAVLLVVAVVVVVVLATRNSSTKPSISVPVSGAVTVQRRDLVQTDTESGTVGYANPRSVYDQLAGTLTWLPSVGALIKPGQRLFEVDDRPVVLMNGTTPAYRELAPGDSDGQDILELNRSLADLGFNPDGIVVDDSWQPATSAGVEALQKSLGETATGSLPLGQVVFLPGDQIVASVDANLGSPGGGGAGATPILQTTSAHLIVTVDLPPSSQSEARVGEQVSVEMQAGNVVPGVITAVSSVAANGSSAGGSSPSSGSSATIPVTIKLRGHVSAAGLDQSSVSVSFAQAVAKNVLSVPVTALLATSGGGFVLQQARAPHRLIAVTTGLFAAGYVQVSGAGIRSGLQVTDSQG
jgi:peptidoglycan hydrolase-like protein with peptidoglycan-binding domain